MNLDTFSINNCFDEAVRRTQEASVMFLDFEVSYTHAFFNQLEEHAGSKDVLKHQLMNYSAVHCWEHSEGWPYKPQWQLGFYIEPKFFFFISNIEPYVEKSKEYLEILRPLLKKTKILVGQNFKFDLSILANIMEMSDEEVLLTRVHDLMTMGYSLDVSQKRFNLGMAAKRNLEIIGSSGKKYFMIDDELVDAEWKQEEEFHRTLMTERLWETIKYNREDLLITKAVYYSLLTKMRQRNVTRSLHLYDWFIPFYTLLEKNGLEVDVAKAELAFFNSAEDGQRIQYEVAALMQQLLSIVRAKKLNNKIVSKIKDKEEFERKFAFFDLEAFDFKTENGIIRKRDALYFAPTKSFFCLDVVSGSNFRELISTILADGFGYQISRTPSGNYAFQKDEISKFVVRLSLSTDANEQIIHQILDKMLQINSLKANLARVKAFYILPAKVYPDGRLHSDFKLTGTETGRLSSVRPGIMNMPFRIKALIRGAKKIVQIDLRSAEAKLFMLITQNHEILRELQTNDDTYSVIGMRVFELDEMSKKTRPVERNIMKIGVLAKMYGQSINGLAEQVKIFYDPVRWEIYQEQQKYHFIYKWKCITITNEVRAAEVDAILRSLTDLGDLTSEAKKLRATELAKLPSDCDIDQELETTVIPAYRQELGDLVDLDYFGIAVISDQRLEETINSGKYEDWVCKTFFKLDDPANSYVMSPVGLLRNHDMSSDGLVLEPLNHDAKDLVYRVLKLAYEAFFIRLETFIGSFYNNGDFVKIECRRLHAFNAFTKVFSPASRKRQIPSSLVKKMAKTLGDEELYDDIMRILSRDDTSHSYSRSAIRLAAKYRESLNLPIQGPSSFINSYIGYKSYRACIANNLDTRVVNTIHDAVHFDCADENKIDEFSKIASDVYVDMDLLEHLLEDGLKAIHPELDEFVYIPIGGDIEICDTLDEAK